MKDKVINIIDSQKDEIIQLGRKLFENPELGYKEFKTKDIIVDYLKGQGLEVESEYFETGFQVSIGSGKPHIGLIAELDAIPTLNHPYANLEDQSAAHACGHSTQCAIMVNALVALKKSEVLKEGKITLFFTPAEEFTDLAYRNQLIKDNKIKYIGGKVNMLVDGIFNDVDVILHLHAMGEGEYKFSLNSSLAGFIYKKYVFLGKASHAAMGPHLGVNALNAFALFQSASAMLRETFVDEDKNRVHGIITEGGNTVNSIPSQVVYESYIRSFNTSKLTGLSEQYTKTAKHCAEALNAKCEVYDTPGYLPLTQNELINSVIKKNMLQFVDPSKILHDEKSVAAGDMGDLGCFIPSVQFGYGGINGAIHGANMCIADEQLIYQDSAKIVAMTVVDLLENPEITKEVKETFTPQMTMDEYLKYLNN